MKLFCYLLLVIAIVFQSFAAIAVGDDDHQMDVEHLQQQHSHLDDTKLQQDNNDAHNVNDCHHCGHCTGNHATWVTVKTEASAFDALSVTSFYYLIPTTHAFTEAMYRPPIA
nr:hypothetical protein [Thalassotalea sediminis]